MMHLSSGHLLQDLFTGVWLLQRQIYSPGRDTLYAQASGNARFEPGSTEALIYHESGKVLLQATQLSIPFRRSFRYVFSGDHMCVYFHDGADAGKLYLEYTTADSSGIIRSLCPHQCLADTYDASYEFSGRNRFLHRSYISGPKKDMFIETVYTRPE